MGMNFALILCLLPVIALAQKVTVSGLSSGGFFAHQFHVAHSSWVNGAGILAAGPYHCAKDSLDDAFNRCMEIGEGAPDAQESLAEITKQFRLGRVDDPRNLRNSKIYVLSGTEDRTVVTPVVDALVAEYETLGAAVIYEKSLAVGHAFPTATFGNDCSEVSRAPYISQCRRDVAGEILRTLLGALKTRARAQRSNLYRFNQAVLGGIANPAGISLAIHGVAYVPAVCQTQRCQVHVAFHGCRQTIEDVGDAFYARTGYNPWAEANGVVVVYPQVIKQLMLGNPRGCWDWWGYTGKQYHTKVAPQIAVIANIARAFATGKAQLLPLEENTRQE